MNERIRELADQVELTIRDSRGNTYMSHPEFNKKFAELIARECAKISLECGINLNREDYRQGIARNIKKHFGVEE